MQKQRESQNRKGRSAEKCMKNRNNLGEKLFFFLQDVIKLRDQRRQHALMVHDIVGKVQIDTIKQAFSSPP